MVGWMLTRCRCDRDVRCRIPEVKGVEEDGVDVDEARQREP